MLSGIVGIVSGGASGLGAAATRALIRNGGKVVVAGNIFVVIFPVAARSRYVI